MPLWAWTATYAAQAVFWLWLARGGGASWLSGTIASGFLVHWLAPRWSQEGLRLFAWGSLLASSAWFAVGLLVPEARFHG